jgi:hypothetical protein
MNTAAAKSPRPLRLNRTKADLVPTERFARWLELASATPGLSGLELALLSAIASYHRQLQEKGMLAPCRCCGLRRPIGLNQFM